MTGASLRWHYEDGTWWAESPESPEWSGGADSLDEARLLAHSGLRWLGASSVLDPFGELVDTTPRRLEALCVYCGRKTQGLRTCGYCTHLPWLDPYFAPADQWADAR